MAEVKIKSSLRLFPWQQQVMFNLREHWKGYIHVIKAKRQCGKSVLLYQILIQAAIERTGSVSICLSPKLEQAAKVYEAVKKVILPTKLYKKHNDNARCLFLVNGSALYFKSAEQKDTLRGNTVTGIYCIDEAAFIPETVFYDTLPWVNVSQAPIVMVSSPQHKTGFFYKYYMCGLSNDEAYKNILSYNWSEFDTSELLPPEKMEEYRRTMPATQFKTEYLGEFLDNEGGVFGEFDKVVSNNFNLNGNCYFGIDWGSGQGQDETAISVFNGDRQMIALYHFSDKDETQTINYIIELMKKHKPLKCQVETNSIGQVFYGLLDKAIKANRLPVMLLRFTTTNDSKERLINNFQVAIQNQDVQILDDTTLKIEMDMYECKVNSSGKRIYNATSGYHDDCVISTLLAFDCISKGNYNFSII